MKTYVTVEKNFAAAHFLNNNNYSKEENASMYGKCNFLHGHNYKLFVTVEGDIKESGMIINFKELKGIIEKTIIEIFDHSFLNDKMDLVPTAENIGLIFWDILEIHINKDGNKLHKIKIYENDRSCFTMCE